VIRHVTSVWKGNNMKLRNNLVKNLMGKAAQKPQDVNVSTGIKCCNGDRSQTGVYWLRIEAIDCTQDKGNSSSVKREKFCSNCAPVSF